MRFVETPSSAATPTSSGSACPSSSSSSAIRPVSTSSRSRVSFQARSPPAPSRDPSRQRGDVCRRRADSPLPGGTRARCSSRSRQVEQAANASRRSASVAFSTLESCPMTQIVVPYRGENGKQRLDTSDDARSRLALAMLEDVLAAATVAAHAGRHRRRDAQRAGAELGAEPVATSLEVRARRSRQRSSGKAKAPCSLSTPTCRASCQAICARSPARPNSVRRLVEAEDGTTNALALRRGRFSQLYGAAVPAASAPTPG